MNKFFCWLTGGHEFSDKNLISEQAPDGRCTLFINHCVKCGEKFVYLVDMKSVLEAEIQMYRERSNNNIANGVTVNEWISVEERLPEDGQEVLCYRGKNIGGMMNTYTCLDKNRFEDDYGYCGTVDEEGITHWMPLPQPPKEVE